MVSPMERFPPAASTPHFELRSIGLAMDDLAPTPTLAAPRRDQIVKLLWALFGLICLLAFVGWLLVG